MEERDRIPVRNNGIVWIDPDRMGGTPCFSNTRVSIRILFDNLLDGLTIEEIIDSYPTLTKDAVVAALEKAGKLMEGN